MAMIEQSSGGGGGSFFAKKLGPLPVWGWVAIAVVGYYLYSKTRAGGSSGSSQYGTTIPTAAQETLSGPGGYYSGPWGGAPAGITSPTPGGGSGTQPQFGPQYGAGFLPSGATGATVASNPGTLTQQSDSGQTYLWLNPSEYRGLPGNTPIYYEPTPGNFVPGGTVGKNTVPTGTAGGSTGATPVYIQQPGG